MWTIKTLSTGWGKPVQKFYLFKYMSGLRFIRSLGDKKGLRHSRFRSREEQSVYSC